MCGRTGRFSTQSSGGPLDPWNNSIEPGLPANLDIEVRPDRPIFSTRAGRKPSMAPRDKPMSEQVNSI
jgi:hypothetical protein